MPIEKPGNLGKYNLFDGIIPQLCFSKEEWNALPAVTMPNVILIEKETGKIKYSDGVNRYPDLKYAIEHSLTDEQLKLLQDINKPDGLVKLTTGGLLPDHVFPERYRRIIKTVMTYQEMVDSGNDAITGDDFKLHAVICIDATGDPSGKITKGGAWYAWYDPDGAGDLPSGWQITGIFEEPTLSLTNYFKFTGTAANTIGDIIDDVDESGKSPDKFKKFSFAEHAKLATIEEGADVTDAANVEAAGAVMYTHTLIGRNITAERLEELFGTNA